MGRHKKIYSNTMVIMFIGFLASISIMHVFTPDMAFSDSENRVLEQLPKLSLAKVIEGKFTSDFETYVSDQFPDREMWIGVKSDVERAMGKRENNGVFLGMDGYLLQKFEGPDRQDLEKKLDSINTFVTSIPETNKYFMLVPNSVEILKSKLPKNAPVLDQLTYIEAIKAGLVEGIKFVDIYEHLYSKREEYIYYRTDHHWTSKGAYCGYVGLMSAMGISPMDENEFHIERVTDDFYGTLYSKSGFRHMSPDTIDIYKYKTLKKCSVEYYGEDKIASSIYDRRALDKKDKYQVFLGGNYPYVKITTDAREGSKLLIVKDSYANSLVPFLLAHYDEIYLIDLRYYDENICDTIKSEEIDDVLILYNVSTFFEDQSIVNLSREGG